MTTTKTPIMVLQELTVKRNWPSPEYSLIYSKQGTHENEFHYKIEVRGFTAYGFGTSKQRAKHSAASELLKKLKEHDLFEENEKIIIKAPKQTEKEPSSNNVISLLREKCNDNKLPDPQFEEISDVGPPHCREFTFECKISNLTSRGTAGTKKLAKQLAAQEMLKKLVNTLPDFMNEHNVNAQDQQTITDMDDEAMKLFRELRPYSKPKPNVGLKIDEYTNSFAYRLQEKELTYEDIKDCLSGPRTVDTLQSLLDKLELNYGLRVLQEIPEIIVSLTLTIDSPFTVCYKGKTEEEASAGAISKALEYLSILLK